MHSSMRTYVLHTHTHTHTHTHARMHACVCAHTQTIRRRLSRKSRIRRRASYTALFLTVMFPVPRCLSVEHTPGHAHKCMCSCVRAHTSTPARTHALSLTHTLALAQQAWPPLTAQHCPPLRATLRPCRGFGPPFQPAHAPTRCMSPSKAKLAWTLCMRKLQHRQSVPMCSDDVREYELCNDGRLCAFTIAACKPLDLNPKP